MHPPYQKRSVFFCNCSSMELQKNGDSNRLKVNVLFCTCDSLELQKCKLLSTRNIRFISYAALKKLQLSRNTEFNRQKTFQETE